MIRILLILLLIVYPCKSELQEKICTGEDHSCSISTKGKVRCWGLNNRGQLGYGDTLNRGNGAGEMGSALPYVDLGDETPVDIICGGFHTCVLLSIGQIKCWGGGGEGQLGYGDRRDRGNEPGEMGSALPFVNVGLGRTVRMVSAGDVNTCVVLDTKDVKCWGYGVYGVPGLEVNTNFVIFPPSENMDLGFPGQVEQVSVGKFHACARLTNRRVKCWGQNTYGQLGLGDTNDRGDGAGEMGSGLPLIDLGSNHQVTYIKAGFYNTCARLTDETVKCWGLNTDGQLGFQSDDSIGDQAGEMGDDLPSINFGTTSANVREIELGKYWTCVVFVDGRLKCFGDRGESSPPNDNDAYVDFGTESLVRTLGLESSLHACVVFVNGQVKCWGQNEFGQLGLGDTVERFDFTNLGINLPFVDLEWESPPPTTPNVVEIVIPITVGLIVLLLFLAVIFRYYFYRNDAAILYI